MWPYCITITLQIRKLITGDKQCQAKMPAVIYIYIYIYIYSVIHDLWTLLQEVIS